MRFYQRVRAVQAQSLAWGCRRWRMPTPRPSSETRARDSRPQYSFIRTRPRQYQPSGHGQHLSPHLVLVRAHSHVVFTCVGNIPSTFESRTGCLPLWRFQVMLSTCSRDNGQITPGYREVYHCGPQFYFRVVRHNRMTKRVGLSNILQVIA